MLDDLFFKPPITDERFYLTIAECQVGPFITNGKLDHLVQQLLRRGVRLVKDLAIEERRRRFTKRYTRAQASEDGILVNLSAEFPECHRLFGGYPTACTSAVWEVIWQTVDDPKSKDDFKGVVLELLKMSTRVFEQISTEAHLFQLTVEDNGEDKLVTLCAVTGPGDCCEPVVTIMLQDE